MVLSAFTLRRLSFTGSGKAIAMKYDRFQIWWNVRKYAHNNQTGAEAITVRGLVAREETGRPCNRKEQKRRIPLTEL